MSESAKKKAAPKKRPAAPKISPALRKFLREWLEWAEAGGQYHPFFRRDAGLCILCPAECDSELSSALEYRDYPFGDEARYDRDWSKGTMHLNPLRLAWVRKMLGRKGGAAMSESAKKKAAPKKRPAAPKISPALRKFLREWLKWAEAGAPDNALFSRSLGLCGAAYLYSGGIKLRVELQEKLAECFDDTTHPFSHDILGHAIEINTRAMHLNPLRLAWVRKMLGKVVAK